MKLKTITLLFILSNILSAQAQVYKIVDADGNVTFSQIEPTTDENSALEVETVNISSGNNAMTSITTEFNKEFCGEIQLPSQSNYESSSQYFVRNVEYSKQNWERSLTQLAKRMEYSAKNNIRANKSQYASTSVKTQQNGYYREEFERNNKRMRDLRCAINWVKSQKSTIADAKSTAQVEKSKLIEIKSKIEESIVQQCGEEPVFDPSISDNKYKLKQWNRCSYSKRKDLRKIQYKLERY